MSGNTVPAPQWLALRVIGGILAYGFFAGFVGLIGMQLHHWLRDGQWTHIGVSDALYSILTSCCVREDAGGAGWFAGFARWLLYHAGFPSPYSRPFHATLGNGDSLRSAELNSINNAIDSATVKFRWQRGDLLLVDNFLVAHGRMPFRGDRRILVAIH